MAEGWLIVRNFVMRLGYSHETLDLVRRLPGLSPLPYMSLLLIGMLLWLLLPHLVKVTFDVQARFCGRISAYTLLATGYDEIKFVGTSKSSTVGMAACAPTRVYRWTVSNEQLQEQLQHLHGIYVQNLPYRGREVKHRWEDGCNNAFKERALDYVNDVLCAEGLSMMYNKCEARTKHGAKPDYSADVMVDGESNSVVVVGEGKTPKVLEGVSDDLTGSTAVAGLRETIRQVWGYMIDAEGEPDAGFFGTPNRVWFFRADRTTSAMYVTDAVHCNAHSPSVRQMLYLLPRLRGTPLPADAVEWTQHDFHRILIQQLSAQQGCGGQGSSGQGSGGQGSGGSQQGGAQQGSASQGGRQGAASRSQQQVIGGASQPAAGASISNAIISAEEFQDRVPIGHGETGTVSAAWLHGLRVAVKFGDCYNSKDIVRRLMNEVATYKALQPLQGSFIPRLEEHGYTMWGGAYFVATQLINGHTHKEGVEVPMAHRRSAEQALAAIHAAGYLHGDVRSDNLIFEDGTGKAFFLDLGFSRPCSCSEDFQAETRELQELLVHSLTSVHSWPRT